jgi:hypothetical protein
LIITQLFATGATSAVLFALGNTIHDASPFPFMAIGILISQGINLIFIIVFRIAKKNAFNIVMGLMIILVAFPSLYMLNRSIDVTKMNALEKSKEIQFAYRYNDDVYYTSSKIEGIYRMSPNGETVKIQDTPRINDVTNVTFWIDKSTAYFLNNSKWYSVNLDTNEVKESAEFKIGYETYFNNQYQFLGGYEYQRKIGYIYHSQIIGDGYIYFSADKGLYRTKVTSENPELLVEGNITLFDIVNGVISYYDVNKIPRVNKVPLSKLVND